MKDIVRDELGAPKIVDRSTFQAELDALRVGEKAHTREGDAIAAPRNDAFRKAQRKEGTTRYRAWVDAGWELGVWLIGFVVFLHLLDALAHLLHHRLDPLFHHAKAIL